MKSLTIPYTVSAAFAGLALCAGLAANTITYNFLISASEEVPAPTTTGSAGYATVELDTAANELAWNIVYTGLTPSAAHFHGNAAAGSTAGVKVGIGALPSPMVGSASISAQDVTDIQNGLWYVNIHTSLNAPGEIRGQVETQLPFTPNLLLAGANEVPEVAAASAGAALVTYNINTMELSWELAYQGIAGGATAMHFHGPGGPDVNAGVRLDIEALGTGGLSEYNFGSSILTASHADELLDGLWYINIHSAAFPGGELRGQVMPVVIPEPSAFALFFGLAAIAALVARRRRRTT